MQSEPAVDHDEISDSPAQLAEKLGTLIAELPEHERYETAEAAVAADEHAQEKIAAFEERREEFALARKAGEATQEDVRELKQFQEELHSMPVMAEYLEAREELTAKLEELNLAISEPLAVDFGAEAGGCCQD